MLCARVVRGAASSAKLVRPAPARRCRPVGVEGVEHAHQRGARLHQRQLFGLRRAHLQHQVAAEGAGRIGDLRARCHVGLVGGMAAAMPAPDWIRRVWPWALSFFAVSGVTATRVSASSVSAGMPIITTSSSSMNSSNQSCPRRTYYSTTAGENSVGSPRNWRCEGGWAPFTSVTPYSNANSAA